MPLFIAPHRLSSITRNLLLAALLTPLVLMPAPGLAQSHVNTPGDEPIKTPSPKNKSSQTVTTRASEAPQSASVQTTGLPPLNPAVHEPPSSELPATRPPITGDLPARPYNKGRIELNLWQIENNKFYRSEPVISPNGSDLAYSEVIYMPHNRQTISRLFWVPVTQNDSPSTTQMLPEQYYAQQVKDDQRRKRDEKLKEDGQPTPEEIHQASIYDPNLQLSNRRELLSVGDNRPSSFQFETLTVVDWSATGQKLLFKRRSGTLYVGLKTSDILVFDKQHGTITIYPELHRILTHFWKTNSNLPSLDALTWDILPLGWKPGSDQEVLFEAWAFDKTSRKFLGLWQYNIDEERTELISLKDIQVPIAANGVVVDPPVDYNASSGVWHRKGNR